MASHSGSGGAGKINCFAAKVEQLGIAVVSERLGLNHGCHENPCEFDKDMMRLEQGNCGESEKLMREINSLAGPVVMEAKKRTRSPFSHQAVDRRRSVQNHGIHPDDEFRMFLGGGGSLSKWYRKAIESTYERFKQRNADVPPYVLQPLRPPADLRMPDGEDPFRHAISYGLSIPAGEGPGIAFPSKIGVQPPRPIRPHSGVAYEDSKAAFD